MPDPGARASASVPVRSVQPGKSPVVPGRGGSFGPVRYRVGDRHGRGHSRAGGRELLVIARLADGDCGQASYVKKAPQPLVTGGIVRSGHCLVVLAEELLVLSFGSSLRITSGSAGSSVGCAVT